MAIVQHETFAPILYLMKYTALEEAIYMQNNVPQGLSSAIMTLNMREAELFLSAVGSDCGIANVNIGTSGAEIGVHLEAKKKRVEAEKAVVMLGKPICAGKPIPLITERVYRWHRAFSSTFKWYLHYKN